MCSSDLDFSEADLFGANLEGAELAETMFVRADLRGARLRHASLVSSDLQGADLRPGAFARGAGQVMSPLAQTQAQAAKTETVKAKPMGLRLRREKPPEQPSVPTAAPVVSVATTSIQAGQSSGKLYATNLSGADLTNANL